MKAVLVAASLLVCLIGCHSRTKPPPPATQRGPVLPIDQVIAGINRNNAALTTLWSRGRFEADLVDDRGRRQFLNGSIYLQHSKPNLVRFIGKKDLAGNIFDVGSDGTDYWLIAHGEQDTMWHGKLADAERSAQRASLPFRPDLMLDVVSLTTLQGDLLAEPAPVVRYNGDQDAYMIVWHEQSEDHLRALREVWYDRATLLPRLVVLFDELGKPALRAYLSDHRPLADASQIKVATKYDLLFPDSGSKMTLTLEELRLRKDGAPRPVAFVMPSNPGVSHSVDLDDASAN